MTQKENKVRALRAQVIHLVRWGILEVFQEGDAI